MADTKMVPGATIQGDYNTYEKRAYRDLNETLGNVVTLRLDKLVVIEEANWFSGLKVTALPGVKISIDGQTVRFSK